MNSARRMLLFTGGNLGEWALHEVAAGDFLIGIDRGALFLLRHDLRPDFAVGDFDSVSLEDFHEIQQRAGHVVSCDPIMKDLTDTDMGVTWAIQQQPQEIVILGALGTRFDHTLANVHLLRKSLDAGIPCRIIDEKNEVLLIDRPTEIAKGRFPHISLLPLSQTVTGITLYGFQYPLHKATLTIGDSIGISNVLVAAAGKIDVRTGQLLVIKSTD